MSGYRIRRRQGTVLVDADPLIFYHFHNVRILSRHLFDLGLHEYGARLSNTLRSRIYLPYLRELQSLMKLASGEYTRNIRYRSTTEYRTTIGPLLLVVRGTSIPDEHGLLTSGINKMAQLQHQLQVSEAEGEAQRQLINQRDGELARLAQEVQARDTELARLAQEVQARDTELARLAQEVQARDTELARLAQEVQARDTELARLAQGGAGPATRSSRGG